MAGVYKTQGEYTKALEFREKALAIRERVLGTEHPNTAATYNNMASVHRAKGDYEKALEYYKKANAVFRSVVGENHPRTQSTSLNIMIIELLQMTGMTEDALREMLFRNDE